MYVKYNEEVKISGKRSVLQPEYVCTAVFAIVIFQWWDSSIVCILSENLKFQLYIIKEY